MAAIGRFCADIRGDTFLLDLRSYRVHNLRNGHLVEVYKHVKSENIPWKSVQDSLMSGEPTEPWVTVPRWAFPKAFSSVYHKSQRLSRSVRDRQKLNNFLDQPADLLRLCQPRGSKRKGSSLVLDTEPEKKKSRFDNLVDEVVESTSEELLNDLARLQDTVTKQQKEITQLRKENAQLHKVNTALARKVQIYCPKRVNQTLRRKNTALTTWREKHRSFVKRTTSMVEKVTHLSQTVRKMKENNRKMRKRHEKRGQQQRKPKSLTDVHAKALVNANERILSLEKELLDVSQIASDDDNTILVKLDGKTFSHDLREASYSLQALGVAESKVGAVVETVVNKVAHKTLSGKLPSTSTQAKMASEMKVIAREQIQETLKGHSNLTLKYDGTTKRGTHLTEVELSTGNQTNQAGLSMQCGASAEDYVNTIQRALQDCSSHDEPLLKNVTNTMTDRCATNTKVDRDLEELKGGPLNSFRCAAHPLDTFAHACESAVREYEKTHPIVSPSGGRTLYTKGAESQTHCLVRKLSDLFHNDQTGCRELLSTHLSQWHPDLKYQKVWLSRFVGNRFNILLVNAGRAHLFKESIVNYFQHVHQPTNDLQRCLLNVLVCRDCYVPLRALGLLGAYFTGPWQRLVGGSHSILQLNEFFLEARNSLEAWMKEPLPLVTGQKGSAFSSVPVKENAVFKALTTTSDNDANTAELVKVMCQRLLEVVNRQLADQLPGGKFWQPSTELQEQSQTCKGTNISGERVFGQTDAALKKTPNACIAKVESKLMFGYNKTADWLADKQPSEKVETLRNARVSGPGILKVENERKVNYQLKLHEKLRCKRVQLSEKEAKNRDANEKLIEDTLAMGLWTTPDIDNNIEKLTVARQKLSLRVQIKALTKVIGVKHERKLALTKASVPELKDHLAFLLTQELSPVQQQIATLLKDPTFVLEKAISHKWEVDGEFKDYLGSVGSYHSDTEEYEVKSSGESESYFMSRSEFVTDVIRGDLVLL